MRFPIFTTFAIFAAFTWLYMRITKRKAGSVELSFWERERLANNTRKKPLDSLSYIAIPLESLPFIKDTENETLLECQKLITALSSQKIVNLTGISNTDLKLAYGVANITVLSEYDQNFTMLARTLYSWGKELYSLNMKKEAQDVLEFAISCKTDITGNYTLLADIYTETQTYDKIDALIETAESLHSLTKNSILSQLKEKSVYALLHN